MVQGSDRDPSVSLSQKSFCLWPQLAGGKPELEADFKKEGRER